MQPIQEVKALSELHLIESTWQQLNGGSSTHDSQLHAGIMKSQVKNMNRLSIYFV